MAKNRIINTRFWDDNFIRSLSATDKLLFLYLITNPLTNICGIYEISKDRIVFDTGLRTDIVEKSLQLLIEKGKICYFDGWIKILNFAKYQNGNSPKIQKGIENELNSIPCEVKEKFDTLSIPYTYPIDTISHLNSNSNSNLNSNINIKKEKVKMIIECFEQKFKTKILSLSERRKSHIEQRLKTYTEEQILTAIKNYASNSFYTGNNDRGWKADIDFIIRSDEQIEKGLNLKSKQIKDTFAGMCNFCGQDLMKNSQNLTYCINKLCKFNEKK